MDDFKELMQLEAEVREVFSADGTVRRVQQ